MAELQQKQRDGESLFRITLYNDYLRLMSVKIAGAQALIKELEARYREKRNELIEAVKKRKVLERLNEKEWASFRKALEKKEQVFINEIAISGFNMRKKAPQD